MFAPTVGGGLGLEKWRDCGKGGGGLTVWKRGRGTPPPCRAPPLGEEASGEWGSPLRWVGVWGWRSGRIVESGGGWFNGWKGDGAMWASPPTESLRRCAPPPFSREAFGFADSVPGKNNPPEGGTGGCCRRKENCFSPLNRGERLSGKHAAAASTPQKGRVLCIRI